MFDGRLNASPDRAGTFAVTGDLGKTPHRRPSAVAVHDNGDVARTRNAHVRRGRLRTDTSIGHATSDLTNVLLFLPQYIIHLLDVLIGELLYVGAPVFCHVLTDFMLLLVGFDLLHAV